MSTWNLGANDVSEETRTFRDKLASKDGQIAAQEDRLSNQAADLEDVKQRLNEALQKLTFETRRALELEDNVRQRSEDLRNEKIASENLKAALSNAQEKNKENNRELRDLETTLERISHTSDCHQARCIKLEKEKFTLEARVKELEANLRGISQPTPTITPSRRHMTKPRSSSLSNVRITTLELDVTELRSQLTKRDAEMEHITQKLSRAQDNRNKADNERVAAERMWRAQVEALRAALEEKEEELLFMKEQGGDGSREEELLKRIEEDEAKIAALETMARGAEESKDVKEKVQRLETQLQEERRRRVQLDERNVDLVKEKDEILDALEEARREVARIVQQSKDREVLDHNLNERASKSLEINDGIVDVSQTHAETLSHIEKLLMAVDRLRGERDALRRDLQFLESESRFTIEALERKVTASVSAYTEESDYRVETSNQMKSEMDELHARLTETIEDRTFRISVKNREIQRLGHCLEGMAIVSNQLLSSSAEPHPLVSESLSNPTALQEVQDALGVLEEKYESSVQHLEATASHRDNLLIQLQDKNAEWEREFRMAEHDIDELKKAVSELNAHIDHVESERDSLALQVTNLTTDLQNAQDEISTAESRYTNLQFHQLSNMTSNEATRTLRDHIEELEARVMRRTEQIGIHQHDIRRLETNLRLQEERLSEMTTELEMMAAQKDAMVEDCADARESRDEALVRVEALEDELEASGENERLVIELIGVIVDTAARGREAIRLAKERQAEYVLDLENQRTLVQKQLDDKESFLKTQPDDKESFLKTLAGVADQNQVDVERANTELAEKQMHIQEALTREDQLQRRISNLEAQIDSLRQQDHDSTIRDLQEQKVELEMRLQEQEKLAIATENARKELTELKQHHAGSISELQERLSQSERHLEELQIRYKSAEDDHGNVLKDATLLTKDLERQLETMMSDVQSLQERRAQFQFSEQEQLKKIDDLEKALQKVSQDHEDVLHAREDERTRLEKELERLQVEKERHLADLRDEHLAAQQELKKEMQSLQNKLEETVRLLDTAEEEAAQLVNRLREETEGRVSDQREHGVDLRSAKQQTDTLEGRLREVDSELLGVRSRLQQVEDQVDAAEIEKTILRQDMTTLEAEIQKLKSINRYIDAQGKESEHNIVVLKGDIERLRQEIALSEKACKAAEVNLSLQNAQHKRETAELQRELSSLRSRPNLAEALHELEERNNEMEELLKTKCAEIEANDDRVLEMLKEKKRLTTKVESLNRKVQNLQAKLAAAKVYSTQQAAESKVPQPPSTTNVDQTPTSFSAPASRPRAITITSNYPTSLPPPPTTPPTSVARKPSQRVVSGPSSLPKPKTPERSRLHVPVFRARTPERAAALDLTTNVVIGKKRTAPDDFEACENIPVQAFSADGKDAENRTPRVRRVLSSLQSSFTPNRNHNRPTVPLPSPKRPELPPSSASMSDMTNSPFGFPPVSSAKPSKRSWLGKIRGTSQAVERPSNTRTFLGSIETS